MIMGIKYTHTQRTVYDLMMEIPSVTELRKHFLLLCLCAFVCSCYICFLCCFHRFDVYIQTWNESFVCLICFAGKSMLFRWIRPSNSIRCYRHHRVHVIIIIDIYGLVAQVCYRNHLRVCVYIAFDFGLLFSVAAENKPTKARCVWRQPFRVNGSVSVSVTLWGFWLFFFPFCLLLSFSHHSLLHRSPLCRSVPRSTTHLRHFLRPTTQSLRTKALRKPFNTHFLWLYQGLCFKPTNFEIPQTQPPIPEHNDILCYTSDFRPLHWHLLLLSPQTKKFVAISPFDLPFSSNLLSHRLT